MATFAIATPTDQKHVDLLCTGSERNFTVVNGGWSGSIKDGVITIRQTKDRRAGFVVWRGELPPHCRDDYEEAISWIDAQLAEQPA
ncbi:MAG TPA: hypothetical protein P5256_06385 [Beijerinckiaceae bacterium]|nr:hypothetical protein [Rhodoblastus sp.]MCC2106138.1 hypothetical protein [Hyphomicrobiales bacterium]HPG02924.1 hypothetical protein [Rhodoblastus sp.]HRY02731.1 hypothetical protein [Beijerinckiaceae bacterium]